ncbi:hypothetical protein CDAR_83841 [Caerostris darwini]|uniref:DNA topoisomerase I DNA binding eukaryotic-type domain-containing protein n=1 Tax=Caerostris darwini TaxID=1538125 RepID=A0AAV4U3D3_9ARAC|nr:hypothetical protein CDAR_83841 [Caerostris darwini]
MDEAMAVTEVAMKVNKEQIAVKGKKWKEQKVGGGIKWQALSQNVPIFAPVYERKPMQLSKKAEEVAGVYGRSEEQKVRGGIKWQTLSHNGPIFSPTRVRNHARFYYSGKPMQLSKKAEEVVGCWIMNTLQKHKSTGISLKIGEQ